MLSSLNYLLMQSILCLNVIYLYMCLFSTLYSSLQCRAFFFCYPSDLHWPQVHIILYEKTFQQESILNFIYLSYSLSILLESFKYFTQLDFCYQDFYMVGLEGNFLFKYLIFLFVTKDLMEQNCHWAIPRRSISDTHMPLY